jgi:hypothetical protein
VLDPLHPPAGDPARAPLVELRHDLVLEQGEEAVGLELVALGEVGLALGRADGPAVLAVEHLVPPAVEDRAVEGAVERRLLAARAARLLRSARVVEPDVGALVQDAGDGDVVVVDEHEAVADGRVAREGHDLADDLLAEVVGRVRLAGEDELARALAGGEQGPQPLGWLRSRVPRL